MAVITVGTNSYVTEAELTTYATDRGIIISASDKTILLIKAMDYLNTRSWIGTKYDPTQTLDWPRQYTSCYQYQYGTYYCEDQSVVPNDIKNAQIVAALLIDGGEVLQPTIGRLTKREKVDVLEVEYMNGSTTSFHSSLNDLISPYLSTANIGVKRV